MKKRIGLLLKRLLAAVQMNPVEMVLSAAACCSGFILFDSHNQGLMSVVTFFPALFLLAYIFNGLTVGRRWRIIYYLSVSFFVPPFLFEPKGGTAFFFVTMVVVQLIYLIYDWKCSNDAFVQKGLCYLKAVFSAGVLSGITWLLSWSIFSSIQYMFEIWQYASERYFCYSASIIFLCILPLLFLLFNQEKEWHLSNKLLDSLFDYVLSPALLIYAAILYLYFVKITFLWSLPKGNVAYLVVSFVAVTFLLKGCRSFFGKGLYDWFYQRASWVVLPTLAMYWIGVFYRINEYGYTEARVYLVAVGAALTGMAVLFFSKQTGRYLYAACWMAFCLSVITYLPRVTAKDIERVSQTKRGNYPIRTGRHRENRYVRMTDPSPLVLEGYATLQAVDNKGGCSVVSTMEEGTFSLFDESGSLIFRENADKLLARQLKKAGLAQSDSIPESAYPEILRLELDSALYVFGEISVTRNSPDSAYSVSYMGAGYYLKKRVSLPEYNK